MTSTRRGLVLLPAIAGVNEYIHRIAARLDKSGWAVETINYFSGASAPDLSTPSHIMAAVQALDDLTVVSQIASAVQSLKARNVEAVGVLGYCIGGSYAMFAGASVDGIKAAANYYGSIRYAQLSSRKPFSPLDRVADLRVPMIAHYGSSDAFVPSSHVDELEQKLEKSGRIFELFRYAGAPHAFDEDFRASYRPVASAEAWKRTLTFLDWFVR